MSGAPPLIVDASVAFAAMDQRDAGHQACAELLRSWTGELVMSPFVAAEVDHFIRTRLDLGFRAVEPIGGGAFRLLPGDES